MRLGQISDAAALFLTVGAFHDYCRIQLERYDRNSSIVYSYSLT